MQLSAFAWVPFAMIGVGFIFILVSALGLYLILGRATGGAVDQGQYGVPYVPQDAAGRPLVNSQPLQGVPPAQVGYLVDPATGQPIYPPVGNPAPSSNAAYYPSPTNPSPRGRNPSQTPPPVFCARCGFQYQHESQQFCPRCGTKRTP